MLSSRLQTCFGAASLHTPLQSKLNLLLSSSWYRFAVCFMKTMVVPTFRGEEEEGEREQSAQLRHITWFKSGSCFVSSLVCVFFLLLDVVSGAGFWQLSVCLWKGYAR